MIPITIITGFLGSGKTTLILNLVPQLPKTYKLALLKNEFGDIEIDTQLASSAAISGVREMLNGCICCNLVGSIADALSDLSAQVSPDRILIETSGSAFPATLALEVNRVARETGAYVLDGVISVVDVENWKGYEDTSYTAKMQAQYTDLVVLNKWEGVEERRLEDVLDRLGDLEVNVPTVKSVKGKVDKDVLLGLDSALARKMGEESREVVDSVGVAGKDHDHAHDDHQSEVDVLSLALLAHPGAKKRPAVDLERLETFLLAAPKDEIYRIKAIVNCSSAPSGSDGTPARKDHPENSIKRYILNWAFGRWTFTSVKNISEISALKIPDTDSSEVVHGNDGEEAARAEPPLRMTIITARYESTKWQKKILEQGYVKVEGSDEEDGPGGELRIQKIS